jgi:hypothetical protein
MACHSNHLIRVVAGVPVQIPAWGDALRAVGIRFQYRVVGDKQAGGLRRGQVWCLELWVLRADATDAKAAIADHPNEAADPGTSGQLRSVC